MAASVQVSYQLSSLPVLGLKVFTQNPPTKTENDQGRNAQTDAATTFATILELVLSPSQVPGGAAYLAPLANWRDRSVVPAWQGLRSSTALRLSA